jgi:hypothetical protein
MPTVTADKIVNHDMYAKSFVQGYDGTLKPSTYTWNSGEKIGNVYSWIEGNDGNVYWMIYVNQTDYDNQIATYIKHDSSKLNVPDLPAILQQIDDERKASEIAKVGVLQYYLNHYLPYIIGAVVVSIVFPAIYKNIKK